LDIKNFVYREEEVGKTIKSSKKMYVWEFVLDEIPHKFELFDSKLSGKKKIIRNGMVWEKKRRERYIFQSL